MARRSGENATMSFKVINKQLLKNSNKIWEKVEKLLKIDFERKTVYGEDKKYIKNKNRNTCRRYDYKFRNKMPKRYCVSAYR